MNRYGIEDDPLVCWHDEITKALSWNKENWNDVESCTLKQDDMYRKFDCGFGGPEGTPFILWTKHFVYFSCEYDGAESVASVPRNPVNDAPKEHIC